MQVGWIQKKADNKIHRKHKKSLNYIFIIDVSFIGKNMNSRLSLKFTLFFHERLKFAQKVSQNLLVIKQSENWKTDEQFSLNGFYTLRIDDCKEQNLSPSRNVLHDLPYL